MNSQIKKKCTTAKIIVSIANVRYYNSATKQKLWLIKPFFVMGSGFYILFVKHEKDSFATFCKGARKKISALTPLSAHTTRRTVLYNCAR